MGTLAYAAFNASFQGSGVEGVASSTLKAAGAALHLAGGVAGAPGTNVLVEVLEDALRINLACPGCLL